MNNKLKNILIVVLCLIIAGAIGLGIYTINAGADADEPNPNVTLVTVPDQTDFEAHPDWTIPVTEPVYYGENIALEKDVQQNGQTEVYHKGNVNDGDRYTYWEGKANEYPNILTFDMAEVVEMSGARILLNPRQIWGARTQEVEIQISDDNENFTTIIPKTELAFDPMTDNSVYIPFEEVVQAQYIRFVFYSNSGANAGQAAEIEIFAP